MAEDTAARQTPDSKEWTEQDLVDRFQTVGDYFQPLVDYLKLRIGKLGLVSTDESDQPELGKSEFTVKTEEDGIPSIELKFTEPSADKDRVIQTFYFRRRGESAPAEFRHSFGKNVNGEFVKTGERSMKVGEKSGLSCSLPEIDESLQQLKRYSDNIPSHAVWPQNLPQSPHQN